ncbi:hypothetical protein [Psychrobacter lutiphocae]|uniref:hypothetical protein n=1 Tax=Psychrobacter lutiphocae TaxID=540500 RepID=UPI0003618828|nr:hypothetical protein [Psychrobacter lutiphocae]
MIEQLTRAITLSSLFFLTGCLDKEVICEFNGINLNSGLIGLDRKDVITILGEPNHSDLAVKSFEDYSYKFGNKSYGLIVRYVTENHNYYVTEVKCIKSNPKFEVFNRVIWH